ncbi:MAG: serine/threonine-protein kinase [Pseudomonadota bacterium]
MTNPTSDDAPARVDYVALPAGTTIGRYRVLDALGQGGFGITYLAWDTQLDREVALKEYLPAALAVRQEGASVLPRSTEVADDFGWGRERFIDEGRTLASLHDAPAIVKVFDFLEANGTAYMVMERLRGETLERRVSESGPLAPEALKTVLWPVLAGLRKVHDAGFLHRDIKPANIILADDGRATLIDFGASRAAMADRTRTMTAIFTPGYAAPEQFTSARQGPWTDIYGLAATLHFAATGQPPPSAFDRLMEDTYEPLAAGPVGMLDQRLARGIDAGLALLVEQRPRSVLQWRATLRPDRNGDPDRPGEATVVMSQPPPEAVRLQRPAQAPPTPPTPPSPPTQLAVGRRRKRVGWWIVSAGAAAAVTAAGLYMGAMSAGDAGNPATMSSGTATGATEAATTAEPAPEVKEAEAKLGVNDRRRIQMALTAQGFDTRGSDGTFGPRSREMIAEWQKARDQAPTGYLDRAQSQTLLEAAPALPAPPRTPPAASATALRGDGVFAGSLSGSATGGGQTALPPMSVELRQSGRQLVGRLIHPTCGELPLQLAVSASGAVSGSLKLHEAATCATSAASATGRIAGGSLTLELHGLDVSYRGALSAPTKATGEAPSPKASAPAGQPPGQRGDVP